MNREPAAIIGAVTAAATAILALVVAFGLDVSPDQQAAILGVVAVLAPLTATLVTRSWVYAPATVERLASGDPIHGDNPACSPQASPASPPGRN